MDRKVMGDLRRWYDAKDEKILFLAGAPFVGKSWLIEKLCREQGENYIKVSAISLSKEKLSKERLEKERLLREKCNSTSIIVITDVNDKKSVERAKRIILRIRSESSIGNYRIIIESRLVGNELLLSNLKSEHYVKIIKVYPLDYTEFYESVKEIGSCDKADVLGLYMYIGGMPECVDCFIRTGSVDIVRKCQNKLLNMIYNSYDKKCQNILKVIPQQIAKTEASFTYRSLGRSAREREYGRSIDTLKSFGLIHKISRFCDNGFRIFLYDVGLMAVALNIDNSFILGENKIFKVLDGALIKGFIVEEFMAHHTSGMQMFYWNRTRAKARLPFVLKTSSDTIIIPQLCIESSYVRSVQSFCEKYNVSKIYKIYIDTKHCNKKDNGEEVIKLYDIKQIFES